jgi:hypothetical protein
MRGLNMLRGTCRLTLRHRHAVQQRLANAVFSPWAPARGAMVHGAAGSADSAVTDVMAALEQQIGPLNQGPMVRLALHNILQRTRLARA